MPRSSWSAADPRGSPPPSTPRKPARARCSSIPIRGRAGRSGATAAIRPPPRAPGSRALPARGSHPSWVRLSWMRRTRSFCSTTRAARGACGSTASSSPRARGSASCPSPAGRCRASSAWAAPRRCSRPARASRESASSSRARARCCSRSRPRSRKPARESWASPSRRRSGGSHPSARRSGARRARSSRASATPRASSACPAAREPGSARSTRTPTLCARHSPTAAARWPWDCDVLACGYDLVPNLELPRLLGCETAADRVVLGAAQQTSVPGIFGAGELGGVAGLEHALVTGAIAGLAAASQPVPAPLERRRAVELAFGTRLGPRLRTPRRAARPRTSRHARVPLRGRRPWPPPERRGRARGQARDPGRHGPLPGPRLRPGARLPERLALRHDPSRRFSPRRLPCSPRSPKIQPTRARSHQRRSRAEGRPDSGRPVAVDADKALTRTSCSSLRAEGRA